MLRDKSDDDEEVTLKLASCMPRKGQQLVLRDGLTIAVIT